MRALLCQIPSSEFGGQSDKASIVWGVSMTVRVSMRVLQLVRCTGSKHNFDYQGYDIPVPSALL